MANSSICYFKIFRKYYEGGIQCAITCSKTIMETPEQYEKSVQS